MYELMTLQTLPPKNTVDDFDSDIKDGMRPDFLEEVMNGYTNVLDRMLCYILMC